MWALAFAAGLRRGELLALTWGDVDLDADQPTVAISKGYVKGEHGVDLVDTKGGESATVPILLPEAVELLGRHRDAQPGIGSALVWRRENGSRWHPDTVSTRFDAAVAESGVAPRLTMHGTRHSFVSWLMAAGVPVEVVSKYARHASVAFTLDRYRHLLPEDHNVAAERAAAAVLRARTANGGGS
jgi:integrase